MITEDQLEQLSLDWFRETDWDYTNGVDISPDGDNPERDDYRVVVLKDRLAEAVARLNPDLPQSTVLQVVANPDHPSLEQNTRALLRLYTNGVKVEYSTDDDKVTIFAQIIDFQNPDNNGLLVVKQSCMAEHLLKQTPMRANNCEGPTRKKTSPVHVAPSVLCDAVFDFKSQTSRKHGLDDFSVHVGQAEAAALVAVREAFVVDA